MLDILKHFSNGFAYKFKQLLFIKPLPPCIILYNESFFKKEYLKPFFLSKIGVSSKNVDHQNYKK